MLLEKSAGAIIFYKEGGKIYYLLLRYPRGSGKEKEEYWGLAKGRIEKGEKVEQSAKREIKEETGLKDIEFIEGFKEQEKYFFIRERKRVLKKVVYLLAETKTKKIKISEEHLDFKWLSCKQAVERLTFKNAQNLLARANDFLLKKYD